MGDSAALLKNAQEKICSLPGTSLISASSLYETEAVDVPERYKDIRFFNSVIIIETTLSCDNLSTAIHDIEYQLGRIRTGERHAPRLIDIDIIACEDIKLNRDDLKLPHPEAVNRRFVMEPLAEICPDCILPLQNKTAREILSYLPTSPAVWKIDECVGSKV